MEGLSSSGQQRGNVDGKHEKGLGDVRGTQAGPGLTSSDGSSSKAGRDVFVVPSYSLLVLLLLLLGSSAWAGWLAGWLVELWVDSRLATTLSPLQAGDRGG